MEEASRFLGSLGQGQSSGNTVWVLGASSGEHSGPQVPLKVAPAASWHGLSCVLS